MHELGHNLGLNHGGGLGVDGELLNYKPNFLSIMNYNHQFPGIVQGDSVGSTALSSCKADGDCGAGQSCISYYSNGTDSQKSCRRLDYSDQLLPTGGHTPGRLDENDLDETAGLGSGNADLGLFSDCQMGGVKAVLASNGPVDWDGDGVADNRHLSEDIDFSWFLSLDSHFDCTTPLPLFGLFGFDEWGNLVAPASSTSASQSSASVSSASLGAGAAPPLGGQLLLDKLMNPERHRPIELDSETARQHHVLLAVRPAPLVVKPGCRADSKPLDATSAETFFVALIASADFDVNQVDLASLQFHHARPVRTEFVDVNGDGALDLLIQMRASDLHLGSDASTARLSGWLKNSQAFYGEDKVRMVTNMTEQDPECR